MTIKLPPKPEMVQIDRHIPTNYVIRGYTAEQMEAYAREAVRLNMAPLSDEQIVDAYCKERGMRQYVEAYVAGARFAEAAHGIKGD